MDNMYTPLYIKTDNSLQTSLIKIKDLTFAIPFRSNVRHDYCHKFKNSTRDTETSTALDFSKAVIIKDEKYLENSASIDKKEYIELNSKFYFIFHFEIRNNNFNEREQNNFCFNKFDFSF